MNKQRWTCLACGRNKFTNKSPHNCVVGFRKHKLRWKMSVTFKSFVAVGVKLNDIFQKNQFLKKLPSIILIQVSLIKKQFLKFNIFFVVSQLN
jgi:hypothetical protein